MTETAVAVAGVTKVFPIPFRKRSIVAVRDLNLRVESGEVYGLLGPNGSGKSTTLKIILGLVSPTRGRTQIFGRDSSIVATRESVGFLPENPYFYKFLTGQETLRFFGKLCGLRGWDLRDRVQELLDQVGLTDARNQRLNTYSKGMLQRIGLAQALINKPKLVVLDEPTAGVDPAGSRDIRNLIVVLKKSGVTVLLSSHLLARGFLALVAYPGALDSPAVRRVNCMLICRTLLRFNSHDALRHFQRHSREPRGLRRGNGRRARQQMH